MNRFRKEDDQISFEKDEAALQATPAIRRDYRNGIYSRLGPNFHTALSIRQRVGQSSYEVPIDYDDDKFRVDLSLISLAVRYLRLV